MVVCCSVHAAWAPWRRRARRCRPNRCRGHRAAAPELVCESRISGAPHWQSQGCSARRSGPRCGAGTMRRVRLDQGCAGPGAVLRLGPAAGILGPGKQRRVRQRSPSGLLDEPAAAPQTYAKALQNALLGDWCSGNTWVSKTRAGGSIPPSPADSSYTPPYTTAGRRQRVRRGNPATERFSEACVSVSRGLQYPCWRFDSSVPRFQAIFVRGPPATRGAKAI